MNTQARRALILEELNKKVLKLEKESLIENWTTIVPHGATFEDFLEIAKDYGEYLYTQRLANALIKKEEEKFKKIAKDYAKYLYTQRLANALIKKEEEK